MKVCLLTTSFPAYKGHFQSPFIFKLSESLSKQQEVHVVCPFYKESKKKEESWGKVKIHRFQYLPKRWQTLLSQGGIPSNLKKSFFAKIQFPLFIISFLLRSRKIAKRCDIIHAQWSLSALVGVILKKLYKKPLVLTERGAALNLAMKNSITRTVLLWVLNNCDYITANNFEQIEQIKRLGYKDNLLTVPNGVDTDLFKPRDKNTARKKLNLPKDKKIVLFVGWFIERKGAIYLLKVAKELKDILFVFVGEGPELEKYKRFTSSNNMENILFTGPKNPDEIPYYMNAADIFVLPSLSEGRPNVVPEAMASGLPVIATKVNGTPEFIDNNKDGVLIDPKSTSSIISSIGKLINDNKFYKRIKSKSRKSIISKKLTWDNCADTFISIYTSLLK